MSRVKVMTVVGTRPEIIRLSRVSAKLDKYCDHTYVHTGQNYDYELNEIFFKELGIRSPDIFMDVSGASPSQTIGRVIMAADEVFQMHKPDALLLLGDTNSALCAISAKRRKIPIFHMEAGNRCFDFRVPEEINRRIVDHISDINLPYSNIAREYLIKEGIPPDQIIKTGSPLHEVINHYLPQITASQVLSLLGLQRGKYFLVSAHREENVDSPEGLKKLLLVLNEVASRYKEPVIVSTHPRTRAHLEKLDLNISPLVKFMKPFGFFDYINLQMHSHCVLSDSGTVTEESSILNFPALNLRETHERPEGFEEASVMLVGLSLERVLQGIEIASDQMRGEDRLLNLVSDYSSLNVSDKVLRIILSYVDVVQRKTWRAMGA